MNKQKTILVVFVVSLAVTALFLLPLACKDRTQEHNAENLLMMQGARQSAEQPTNTTITVEDNNGVSEYGIENAQLTYGNGSTADNAAPPTVSLGLQLNKEGSAKLTADLNRVEPIDKGKYRVQFAGKNAMTAGESNGLTLQQGAETFTVNNGCTAEAGLDETAKTLDINLEGCELKSSSGKTANVDVNIHINGADYPGPTSSPGTSARSIQTKRSLGCGGDDKSDLEKWIIYILGEVFKCQIYRITASYPGGCYNYYGAGQYYCTDAYREENDCGDVRITCGLYQTLCGIQIINK